MGLVQLCLRGSKNFFSCVFRRSKIFSRGFFVCPKFFSWVFRRSKVFSCGYFEGQHFFSWIFSWVQNFFSWVLWGSEVFLVDIFVGPKFFLVDIYFLGPNFFFVDVSYIPRGKWGIRDNAVPLPQQVRNKSPKRKVVSNFSTNPL